MAVLNESVHIMRWAKEHEASLSPPVCNKLMHKGQLSIMLVGGPNERTDFHLEQGSEFFYQLKGNINLVTIQQGKRKDVPIKEGQVFLLPSRIPHSPQRPESNSIGLVIERNRLPSEYDAMRWYVDESCEQILYEKYFYCQDLGKDLVPIVNEYKQSSEYTSRQPGINVSANPPTKQDFQTLIPEPFDLLNWVQNHEQELLSGKTLNLFANHPDKEMEVLIAGGQSKFVGGSQYETWLHQIKGAATVTLNGNTIVINEGECYVVPSENKYEVEYPSGSIGMRVIQDPTGNRLPSPNGEAFLLDHRARGYANYPHMRRVNGMLYISGISSRRPDNTHIGAIQQPDGTFQLDIGEQTRGVIENLREILKAAGADLSHVVDMTVYLIDMRRDYQGMNAVYNRYFTAENGPCRTCVAVYQLPHPNLLVEMKAIAVAP